MIRKSLTIAAIAMLTACTTAGTLADQVVGGATLKDAGGALRGSVIVTQDSQGLKLTVLAIGLAAGKVHGAHLHAFGKCEGPTFISAGPHLNPGMRRHGSENPDGSHLGDLPNLSVGARGEGKLEVRLIGEATRLLEQLFDADGTALVLHADADDYRTDPTGNSGARIVCGVFSR